MSTTIEVNKQSVEVLLGSGKKNPLLFPNTNGLMRGQMNRLKPSLRICGSLLQLLVALKTKALIFSEPSYPMRTRRANRKLSTGSNGSRLYFCCCVPFTQSSFKRRQRNARRRLPTLLARLNQRFGEPINSPELWTIRTFF